MCKFCRKCQNGNFSQGYDPHFFNLKIIWGGGGGVDPPPPPPVRPCMYTTPLSLVRLFNSNKSMYVSCEVIVYASVCVSRAGVIAYLVIQNRPLFDKIIRFRQQQRRQNSSRRGLTFVPILRTLLHKQP